MNSTALSYPRELRYFTAPQIAALDIYSLPQHIAIIMDGNRRWAAKQSQTITEGHRSGADILLDVLKSAKELGIRFMTLYAFSTENWNRSKEEVQALMWLYETYIRNLIPEMVQQQVRFNTIGYIEGMPASVQSAIADAKAATLGCETIEVIFAINYGARDEMKRAVKKMCEASISGALMPENITEKTIDSYLDTGAYPDPDLFIRTSGEYRVSNFLLWQLCYTELYVIDTLWPDFTPQHLFEAVIEFQSRKRRYGL